MRSLRLPVDQTVASYIGTATTVLLNIALIVATTFAALMAGVGVAIGAAWSGLLAHLAAGVFLLILRPFKVGDFITAGRVQGTVEEIGLFVTRIITSAIRVLRERLPKIPNILDTPRPDVEILQFNPLGPVLAVRPCCNNQHYWQVYFDTNRAHRRPAGERALTPATLGAVSVDRRHTRWSIALTARRSAGAPSCA